MPELSISLKTISLSWDNDFIALAKEEYPEYELYIYFAYLSKKT